jgi:hypothetical protein
MSDPIPAISESGATGSIAKIYADIRSVYRVSAVNLIWRHLATIPGGLPWVWTTIRPLYADGTVGRNAAALRASLPLPELPPWPTAALSSAGLQEGDIARIRTVLGAYDRTNAMALMVFLAVQLRLEGVPLAVDIVSKRPAPVPAEPEPEWSLPPLLDLAEMSPSTAELVLAINGLEQYIASPSSPACTDIWRIGQLISLSHGLCWRRSSSIGAWTARSKTPLPRRVPVPGALPHDCRYRCRRSDR